MSEDGKKFFIVHELVSGIYKTISIYEYKEEYEEYRLEDTITQEDFGVIIGNIQLGKTIFDGSIFTVADPYLDNGQLTVFQYNSSTSGWEKNIYIYKY